MICITECLINLSDRLIVDINKPCRIYAFEVETRERRNAIRLANYMSRDHSPRSATYKSFSAYRVILKIIDYMAGNYR